VTESFVKTCERKTVAARKKTEEAQRGEGRRKRMRF